jgi:hypothetical protein
MKNVAGMLYFSKRSKIRGIPTRDPYCPRESGWAEVNPDRRNPVSESTSNEKATATRASPGRQW